MTLSSIFCPILAGPPENMVVFKIKNRFYQCYDTECIIRLIEQDFLKGKVPTHPAQTTLLFPYELCDPYHLTK